MSYIFDKIFFQIKKKLSSLQNKLITPSQLILCRKKNHKMLKTLKSIIKYDMALITNKKHIWKEFFFKTSCVPFGNCLCQICVKIGFSWLYLAFWTKLFYFLLEHLKRYCIILNLDSCNYLSILNKQLPELSYSMTFQHFWLTQNYQVW